MAGGWGDLLLEDVFQDVQFASVREDGCLDPWHTSPYSLNMPSYGHTIAVIAITGLPVAILLGGNAGQGTYFNAVQFASLTPGGGTGAWTFHKHQFTMPRWGHVTVRYNDFVYVIGGAQRSGPGYLNDVQVTTLSRQ